MLSEQFLYHANQSVEKSWVKNQLFRDSYYYDSYFSVVCMQLCDCHVKQLDIMFMNAT